VAPVIVVGNVKGGVAKTTTAVQLALHLSAWLNRVLLIDADPGRSALSWATRADAWPHGTVPVIAHHHPDLPRRLPGLANGFDAVVIDTPHDPTGGGRVGPTLGAAIAVADLLVIPTPPAPADLDRLDDLLAAVDAEEARRDLDWSIAITRADLRRRTVLDEIAEALDRRGLPVFTGAAVPERAVVEDAFGTDRRLIEYFPLAAHVFKRLALEAVA
jgi:chromosome partitioning protein